MASRRPRATSKASSPSTSANPDDRYWTAYARGANFEDLRKRGFTVFYPLVDDYAFVPALPENRHMVEKEEDYGVEFLRSGRHLAEVTWRDLEGMHGRTAVNLQVGDPVEVVRGSAEGMVGRVVAIEEQGIRVRLESYKKTYERVVGRLDLLLVKS